MNALLCIGCNQYEFLNTLHGAERDAQAMFSALTSGNFYSKHHAKLLLSPSIQDAAKEISSSLRQNNIDVFTFFFAGHAGGKNGSFFLALRDSEPSALSTTALPLSRMFEMINEFKPRQVNIIVDGCQAGSSATSVSTLLHPENIGTIEASSVSFFGACAAGQSAGETKEGGLLTNHLLKALSGETSLVIQKPIIELSDVVDHVSKSVSQEDPEQQPTWWGLNLFGRGGLTRNPTFHINSPLPSLSMTTVDPNSQMGRRLVEFSSDLWEEYRLISKDFNPSRLNQLVGRLLAPKDIDTSDRIAAISGLINSFTSVACAPGELLSKHLCTSTFLVSLLPWTDDPNVGDFIRQQLHIDFEKTNELLENLRTEFSHDSDRLLANNGFLSDIYYLPMRIARLLGLVGSISYIGYLLKIDTESSRTLHSNFVSSLLSTYPSQLIALDDEQAAPLYIFIKASIQFGWNHHGKAVIDHLYADATLHKGAFNRLDSGGDGALEYLLSITESELSSEKRTMANPSALLAVILLGGSWLKCDNDWHLQAFDRKNLGIYLPDDFRDFAQKTILNGFTHTWQIGFGIWNTKQLATQFEEIFSSREDRTKLSPEAHSLCLLAAMLFPNRIPVNIETL